MKLTIFIWLPQHGHSSGSTSYTRLMSMAHVEIVNGGEKAERGAGESYAAVVQKRPQPHNETGISVAIPEKFGISWGG